MENPKKTLIKELYGRIQKDATRPEEFECCYNSELIKMHNRISELDCDMSFVRNKNSWLQFANKNKLVLSNEFIQILQNLNDTECQLEMQNLLISSNAVFPIERIELRADRFLLKLQRTTFMSRILSLVLNNGEANQLKYGYLTKSCQKRIYIQKYPKTNADSTLLRQHRMDVLIEILHRLLERTWNVVSDPVEDALCVVVRSWNKRLIETIPKDSLYSVVCVDVGDVVDDKTGKPVQFTAEEYIKKRSNDAYLITIHKYGARCHNDDQLKTMIAQLGKGVTTIDLFSSNPSYPVKVKSNSHDLPCVILYNATRMQALLNKFESYVASGVYRPLPDYDDVNIACLENPVEWQLIFAYVFTYPNLIERCSTQIEKGTVPVHLILQFLEGLSRLYSSYYRRNRIIRQQRDHMMMLVYARIYLVKALYYIVQDALNILGITPLKFM